MSKPEVFLASPMDVPKIWARVAEIIGEHPGIRDEFDLGNLFDYLRQGQVYQLWVGVHHGEIEGILITGLTPTPEGPRVHFVGLAGAHLRKYLKVGIQQIENYAMLIGAREVVFDGREKWRPIMQKFGYMQTLQMRKSLPRAMTAH